MPTKDNIKAVRLSSSVQGVVFRRYDPSDMKLDETSGDYQPLAERLRPQMLDEFVGQSQLVGEGAALRQALLAGQIHSMVFWGPPGTGKRPSPKWWPSIVTPILKCFRL